MRSGQPRTAMAATAAASSSIANGSSAVDHAPPDNVTSLGGPSPSNDRITTQGRREAAHSAPAATTSVAWAMRINQGLFRGAPRRQPSRPPPARSASRPLRSR